MAGTFTGVGWQVTLSHPTWQVTLRSSVKSYTLALGVASNEVRDADEWISRKNKTDVFILFV